MVAHDHAARAQRHRLRCVFWPADALHQHRQAGGVAQPFKVLPRQRVVNGPAQALANAAAFMALILFIWDFETGLT